MLDIDNIIKTSNLTYEALDEQANHYVHYLVAEYESDKFTITISYHDNYLEAKQQNAFNQREIHLFVQSKNLLEYPSIAYDNSDNLYKNNPFMILDNCPKLTGSIHAGNYKEIFQIYDEIFSLTLAIRDKFMPKYFPKDATFYDKI